MEMPYSRAIERKDELQELFANKNLNLYKMIDFYELYKAAGKSEPLLNRTKNAIAKVSYHTYFGDVNLESMFNIDAVLTASEGIRYENVGDCVIKTLEKYLNKMKVSPLPVSMYGLPDVTQDGPRRTRVYPRVSHTSKPQPIVIKNKKIDESYRMIYPIGIDWGFLNWYADTDSMMPSLLFGLAKHEDKDEIKGPIQRANLKRIKAYGFDCKTYTKHFT